MNTKKNGARMEDRRLGHSWSLMASLAAAIGDWTLLDRTLSVLIYEQTRPRAVGHKSN